MVRCKVCDVEFKCITHKHLKKHDLTTGEYLSKFSLTKDMLTSAETRERFSQAFSGKKIGDSNPAKRKEVRNKISKTVEKRWAEGDFNGRINGMLGKFGDLSSQYKPHLHTQLHLAENRCWEFLSNFQSTKNCSLCGLEKKINVHHIDEDHGNFLVSNLEPLCVPCHMGFHYKNRKQPFIAITKVFTIASAHFLPKHDGKCKNVHGHEWKAEITVRKRINKATGMVVDFSILKNLVNKHIIEKLDHKLINDYVINPTAENISIYVWETLMFEGLLKGIDSIKIWESQNSYTKLTQFDMLSIFKTNIENYMRKYSTK